MDVSLPKIEALLRAPDDTQRFVGLALLRSVLDNSPALRRDHDAVLRLWASLSPRFLGRLLRSGARPATSDAHQMLDLAVSVLHTFALLLPGPARAEPAFTDRIPALVSAVLHSSEETTQLILQLLHTLASSPEGAAALVRVPDLSPLTEIAPSHARVMDILSFAWLNAMTSGAREGLSGHVDSTIRSLAASFTGTDAVAFLDFLAAFLRRADPVVVPPDPAWLETAVGFIRGLVSSRPTPEARSAYTNAAASLLQAYPEKCSQLLFQARTEAGEEPAFSFLLINLLLIDIRSSAPGLLEQLNQPGYAKTSRRLASAFDVVCIFIGHLVRSLEDPIDDDESSASPSSSSSPSPELVMSPDHLLKLRKSISETMSVTIEYLRDRWDATFAGAMGLHPDARTGAAVTASGSHRTLTWDSLEHAADQDPLVLAAVRALALWLREDDNEPLRKEASGLTDMLLELYRVSSSSSSGGGGGGGNGAAPSIPTLDFRSPALVAIEALVTFAKGRDLLLRSDGWRVLSGDLDAMFRPGAPAVGEEDAARGIELVRVLLQVVEQTGPSTAEEWMDTVTRAAAWDVLGVGEQAPAPAPAPAPALALELQVAVLQLCCALLAGATEGMRRRYKHSTGALRGIATHLRARIPPGDGFLLESMEDVTSTLRGLSL